jgi:hypothetical protein
MRTARLTAGAFMIPNEPNLPEVAVRCLTRDTNGRPEAAGLAGDKEG